MNLDKQRLQRLVKRGPVLSASLNHRRARQQRAGGQRPASTRPGAGCEPATSLQGARRPTARKLDGTLRGCPTFRGLSAKADTHLLGLTLQTQHLTGPQRRAGPWRTQGEPRPCSGWFLSFPAAVQNVACVSTPNGEKSLGAKESSVTKSPHGCNTCISSETP